MMPHKHVNWLIDFRTARSVFSSGSNTRINHCVEQVEAGKMRICHSELKDFRGVLSLKAVFENAVAPVDAKILEMCEQLQQNGYFPSAGKFDLTPVYMVGIALVKKYGVICDCRTTPFVTTYSGMYVSCKHAPPTVA